MMRYETAWVVTSLSAKNIGGFESRMPRHKGVSRFESVVLNRITLLWALGVNGSMTGLHPVGESSILSESTKTALSSNGRKSGSLPDSHGSNPCSVTISVAGE